MKPPSKRIAPGSKVLRARETTADPAAPRTSQLRAGPSRSPAAIFAVAAAALAGAIGILLLVQSKQADPAKIKAELKAKWDEIDRQFGEARVIEKDAALHPLLEVPRYQKYGGDVYAALDKAHRTLHQAAELQKAADAELPAFFKEADATLGDANATDDRVVAALERGQSLWTKYAPSADGPKLKEAVDKLRKLHDKFEEAHHDEGILGTGNKFNRLLGEGNFVEARDLLSHYGQSHHADSDQALADHLADLRGKLTRATAKFARDILQRAAQLRQNGQADQAKRIVEEALPKLEGFEAQAELKRAPR